MKKTLLTLALVAVTAATFAQGKISMVNDANHAVRWGSSLNLKPADIALAGVNVDGLTPLGASLSIELWGGVTAGTMTLQQTTVMSTGGLPGIFGPRNFTSTLPGGVSAFFQVKVRETAFATAELAQTNSGYFAFSPVFNFTPSATIAFANLVTGGGSTWAAAPLLVTANVPEPTSMALAGIGAAAMVIFRRRK